MLQRQRVEDKKQEITDSINYAKKIQFAVLPNEGLIRAGIPDSFIMYLPRDIVSGDFYWHHEIDKENYIFVCADCTGHGVPGAFMTVIGSSLLNQIIVEKKITAPGKILSELDKGISTTLKQHADQQGVIQDGMDLALISVNRKSGEFILTSAKRPSILVRKGEQRELKGSKFTLGGIRSGEKVFEEITVKYEKGDMLYLFTDGYVDQFGGIENKKYMIKRFRNLITEINQLPVASQKQKVELAHTEWKGKNEQTDDVLVVGIRF
jgi:serine phosphatase RsbU (regulator of sigma subunit)